MLGRLREVAGQINITSGPQGGSIAANETYTGGKEKDKHASQRKHQGRGTAGKALVVGVIERTGNVCTARVPDASRCSLQSFPRANLAPDAVLYTDGHPAYAGIGYEHGAVEHSVGEYVRGIAHTNNIESWGLRLTYARLIA